MAVLFVLILMLSSCTSTFETSEMQLGGETFRVEIARTGEQQSRGLMHRKRIGEREGMLFVYKIDRRVSFWMKNTEIPLSIAFITRDGQIVQIEDMMPLSLDPIRSVRSVRYALEVNQGTLARLGVEVGDFVELPEL